MSRDTNPPLGPDEEAALRRRVATGRPFSALYRDMARLVATLDAERARPLDRGRLVRALLGIGHEIKSDSLNWGDWTKVERFADAIADAYEKGHTA